MWYGVKKGKNPGIYENWDACKKEIIGYKGAIFKKFNTYNEAKDFVLGLNQISQEYVELNSNWKETSKEKAINIFKEMEIFHSKKQNIIDPSKIILDVWVYGEEGDIPKIGIYFTDNFYSVDLFH